MDRRKYLDKDKYTDTNEEIQIDPDAAKDKFLHSTLCKDEAAVTKQLQAVPKNSDETSKYNWIRIIGQGTFGVVYKVEEIEEKKVAAIKKVFQDPKYSNREFKIVINLDHPNCIKVHKFFFSSSEEKPEEKYLNLVMDYIPETLYKILRFYYKKSMEFPNPLCKIYTYQMFRALSYLHSLNICHRDIKPQNILIDVDHNKLVVCDFGSAKILKKGETSVAYICSRYYRAPELILGEDSYDCSIDIWAIGCVVAEMVLGEPLFPGKNSKDQFVRIMNILGSPTSQELFEMCHSPPTNLPEIKGSGLSAKLKNFDPELVDFLSKVLVYSPAQRLKPLEALLHPYFNSLRSQKLTINGKNITDLFNFNDVEIGNSKHLLRQLVPEWYRSSKK